MNLQTDSNQNKFFTFKNVRVSVKHANGPDQDWDGTGRYLQILAYRDDTMTTTMPGPQIPIHDKDQTDEEVLTMIWQTLKAAT